MIHSTKAKLLGLAGMWCIVGMGLCMTLVLQPPAPLVPFISVGCIAFGALAAYKIHDWILARDK